MRAYTLVYLTPRAKMICNRSQIDSQRTKIQMDKHKYKMKKTKELTQDGWEVVCGCLS